MYTDSVPWRCLQAITLTEEATSASSRIFVKILFQEIASNLGLKTLVLRLSDKGAQEDNLAPYLNGIFPKDSIQNARFSVNYFTSIGLGALTEDMRAFLSDAPKLMLLEKKYAEMLELANKSDSSSSSSSSDSSDSDSSGSDSEGSPAKADLVSEPKEKEGAPKETPKETKKRRSRSASSGSSSSDKPRRKAAALEDDSD